MSLHQRRSRSTTGVSQRPPSRDSTTSIQSAAPRLNRSESMSHYNPSGFNPQFAAHAPQQMDQFSMQMQNSGVPQQQFHGHQLPMTTEQYHSQMQGASSLYHGHQMQFNAPQQGFDQFGGMQAQQPHHQLSQAANAGAIDSDGTKKRGGAVNNQSNEKELRQTLDANMGRTLKDVAREVLDTERTSRAEKTKQLFAMLWLHNSCETAKTSVPRSRVYSSYADRCATERVQPLNPASFGKLVRIIFKGIATRRLGVRGESKYHYVDLALKEESGENESGFSRALLGHEHGVQPPPRDISIDFASMPRLTADTAVLTPDESPIPSPVPAPRRDLGHADGAVFADPMSRGYGSTSQYSQTYAQHMSFASPEDEQITDEVELPSLWNYTPEKFDEDAADALAALYRSHCTSLIDYFKKCKEKQFWRTYTSFQGTLTVPVQKLLTSPPVAAWIRECDWYMYQKMLLYISRVALQVLPASAIHFFNSVSQSLHAHITKTFNGLPSHVLEARLEPATLFAELLHRLTRVNSAAHAASQVLEQDQSRELLCQDWANCINAKRLMESELPSGNCSGLAETYKILTEDIVKVFTPLTPPPIYDDQGLPYEDPNAGSDGCENYIDRIDLFLRGLPNRFPEARARTIVDCVKNLGTAAMREFTIRGAPTFHAWWVVKMFADEYIQWLATKGAFLAHKPSSRHSPSVGSESIPNGVEDSSAGQSRFGSAAPPGTADFDMSMTNGAGAKNNVKGNLRKRRSDEFENDEQPSQQDLAKKVRLSPTTETQPQFMPQHASFATSFGSNHGMNANARPDTPHEGAANDIDDSGIGLDLFESFTKQPQARKKSNLDRAPLVDTGFDIGA